MQEIPDQMISLPYFFWICLKDVFKQKYCWWFRNLANRLLDVPFSPFSQSKPVDWKTSNLKFTLTVALDFVDIRWCFYGLYHGKSIKATPPFKGANPSLKHHLSRWIMGKLSILNYCWWRKSCTTRDVWNPENNGIFTISTGAGFLPSTVGGGNSKIVYFHPKNWGRWTLFD